MAIIDSVQDVVMVKIQIDKLRERLAARNIELELSAAALDFIAIRGWDPGCSARPLSHLIKHYN